MSIMSLLALKGIFGNPAYVLPNWAGSAVYRPAYSRGQSGVRRVKRAALKRRNRLQAMGTR